MPNLNETPKIVDFENTLFPGQQANESGSRHLTGTELAEKLKRDLTINGQRVSSVPAGVLPAGPAGQTRYMEVTAVGTWTYGGSPVGSNSEGFKTTFWWTGTTWVNNGSVRVTGQTGANGANGKTIEVFNPTKIGGYAVGDSIYFPPTGEKNTYLVLTAAAMGESPTTHPAKFEPVGGGDISDIEFVLSDAINGEGGSDIITPYPMTLTDLEQGGIDASGNNVSSSTRVRNKGVTRREIEGYKVNVNLIDCQMTIHFYDQNLVRLKEVLWTSVSGDYEQLGAKYIRFIFRRSNDSNVTPQNIIDTGTTVDIYKKGTELKLVATQEQLNVVDSKISSLGDNILGNEPRGYVLNGSIASSVPAVDSTGFGRCVMVECNAGDKFEIKARSSGNFRLYAFTDTDRNILEVAPSDSNYMAQSTIVTAPAKGFFYANHITDQFDIDYYVRRYSNLNSNKNIDLDRAVVINDALRQTSASAVVSAFDTRYGLIGSIYLASNGTYGEQRGWVQLAVYSPSKPHDVLYKDIAVGNLSFEPNIVAIGDGVFRCYYMYSGKNNPYYYRDYNAVTDVLSEEFIVKVDIGGVESDFVFNTFNNYLIANGFTDMGTSAEGIIFTSQIKLYDNKLWGTATLNGGWYPVVIFSEDNGITWKPHSIVPFKAHYECEIDWFNGVLHIATRNDVRNWYIRYDGTTFSTPEPIVGSAVSRPQVRRYNGGILIGVTTHCLSKYSGNFPDAMVAAWGRRGFRLYWTNTNSTTLITQWKELLNIQSKYGFVYFSFIDIYNDLYVSWSDEQLASKVLNGASSTLEGKECVKSIKMTF